MSASNQLSVQAIFCVGDCYEFGCVVEQNYEEAFRYYDLAVAQNNSRHVYWLRCFTVWCGITYQDYDGSKLSKYELDAAIMFPGDTQNKLQGGWRY